MNGIFGAVSRDGSPLEAGVLETLRAQTAQWGVDGGGVVSDGVAGLGSALTLNKLEAARVCGPFTASKGRLLTAAGRADNRCELAKAIGLGSEETASLSDPALIYRAWLRFGDSCPERIFGDWAFAVWDRDKRRLYLARDHSGNTAVYYYANSKFFAFSSSRRALLKLNLPPVEMDELFLAQVLVSWPAYHGERTVHKQIQRLPPSHHLSLTPEGIEVTQYWHLENTLELLLPRKDYIPAFLEVFDRAVLDRLRGESPLGVALSGGLDSGSVAVTGARCLGEEGRRLSAFTSVPCFETAPYTGRFFGDEFPFAQATARASDNVDLVTVDAAGLCPIDAIRRILKIAMEPKHAGCNAFWTLELRRIAAQRGCRVLLTGVTGNQSISWAGDIFSQPTSVQIKRLGWKSWLWQSFRRHAPQAAWRSLRAYQVKRQRWRDTAIHPDFAHRLDLTTRYLDAPRERQAQSAVYQRRLGMNSAASSYLGAAQAETGAAYGLDVRDPTGDARVLAFCFSVPDRIFIDPETGVDRWLIREAMKGRLPDDVRMNRRYGRQAGDLVPRLRNAATAVDGALAEIEAGPAAGYVSVPAMRHAWQRVRTEDTPNAYMLAVTVLTRGIMAGLFVNGFGTNW